MVIVCMVLFQWQYQSLCLAMGFGLWVFGVNLGVSGHCNAEQLVSPDHHPMHLKGVAVLYKSTILLHWNALMVMCPHCLVAFANPFQLSLSPNTAFTEPTGSLYPLLVLSSGQLTWSLHLCLNKWCSPQKLCPHQSLPCPPWSNLSQMRPDLKYSSNFLLQYHHQDPVALVGLEKGLLGSCPCCWLKLSPASSNNLGVSSSPIAELCSLLPWLLGSWHGSFCHDDDWVSC